MAHANAEIDMTNEEKAFVAAQRQAGLRHDADNCLACNMWAWSDHDVRPPQVHLWVPA